MIGIMDDSPPLNRQLDSEVVASLEQLQDRLVATELKPSDALELASRYPVIGIGRARLAVAISDQQIVKVAWRAAGITDNAVELAIWQTAPEHIRRWLAPGVDIFGYGLLLMPFCRIARDHSGVALMISQLTSYGISDTISNLGEYRGRLVCYDYASTSSDLFNRLEPVLRQLD